MVVVRGALALAVVAGLAGISTTADAADTSAADRRPAAVISLGDSYMSGEGGRWLGNSADGTGSRRGTDRAFVDTPSGPEYRPETVYGSSAANGCHRSDVAPVTHVRLPRTQVINIACSGAATANVLRGSAGGVGHNGEAPQNDQLALIARAVRIKAIVLLIGGNDVGFRPIVTNCVVAYASKGPPCAAAEQARLEPALVRMREAVGRTIDDIRAVMAEAGYARRSYRLILESYATPQAPAAEQRYPEAGPDRQNVGGCPFYDSDITWGRDGLAGRVGDSLRAVAAERRVQFLDLRSALRGHELCSSRTRQPETAPDEATSEWVRWIDLVGQGELNESLHPNAFGQKALGRCLELALWWPVDAACQGRAGHAASWMFLRPLR